MDSETKTLHHSFLYDQIPDWQPIVHTFNITNDDRELFIMAINHLPKPSQKKYQELSRFVNITEIHRNRNEAEFKIALKHIITTYLAQSSFCI